MTKRIVIALALVVGTTGAASAQTVTARASVPTIAQATGTPRDLIFPAGAPGSTGGAAVDGTTTATGATQLGYQDYRLNYSGPTVAVPVALTLSSTATPANQIDATISCAQAATTAASVTLGDCSGGVALTHTGPGVELRRLFVGGTISQAEIDAAVPANDYTGTITITLTP
ncbi:MAG TPA: hypothetical protein VF039_11610 [Longimicrobiales bacterium]